MKLADTVEMLAWCNPETARKHGKKCGRQEKPGGDVETPKKNRFGSKVINGVPTTGQGTGKHLSKGTNWKFPVRDFVQDKKLNKRINKKVRSRVKWLEKYGYQYQGHFVRKTGQPTQGGEPLYKTMIQFRNGNNDIALALTPGSGWVSWVDGPNGTKKKESWPLASMYRDDGSQGRALAKYLRKLHRK